MGDFSAIYKKTFKQTLSPYGYKVWKGFFYKETENIFFCIQAKKIAHSTGFEMTIDLIPYCADLKLNEYEPPRGYNVVTFYKVLISDKLTNDHLPDFVERFNATDDEATDSSLNTICNDMVGLILPYIHKFEDLNYCYNELMNLKKTRDYGGDDIENNKYYLRDYVVYGLSLKLHKYEDALQYIDFNLSRRKEVINQSSANRAKLLERDLIGTMDQRWSIESREKLAKSILRKQPDFFETQIKACEKTIAKSMKEIARLQKIEEALLSNDNKYLDKLVAETEKDSREYIRQMIKG